MGSKLFLWGVYYPLLKIIYFLIFWLPEVVVRKRFEKKNKQEKLCQSFKLSGVRADFCFEFSSEGEYQQVASLVDDLLREGKRIELVFFSPSVEKAIMELASRHPEQIRYLRYPLVSFGPHHCFSSWVSARELIMVRYDLFPEFLVWAREKENVLKILWVSFKKERVQGRTISWVKKAFLRHSSHLVYASVPDQRVGEELGHPGSLYDFRIEQIRRRIETREEKFMRVFPQYSELKAIWEKYPREKRVIIGNAWPSDLQIMEELPEDFFVMVVPHKLDPEILKAFRDGLSDLDRTVEEVFDGSKLISANTIVLNKKGILCELYADFGKAYIGGGFEGSIHSVLEPLVGGVEQIACGPAHHRSTEFDLAESYGDICELHSSQDFSAWLNAGLRESASKLSLLDILRQYEERKREVVAC